jgi:hypothetical protein
MGDALCVGLEVVDINVRESIDDHLELLLVEDADLLTWNHLVEPVQEVLHLLLNGIDELHLAHKADVPGGSGGREVHETAG